MDSGKKWKKNMLIENGIYSMKQSKIIFHFSRLFINH